jgi:hypothetical protein
MTYALASGLLRLSRIVCVCVIALSPIAATPAFAQAGPDDQPEPATSASSASTSTNAPIAEQEEDDAALQLAEPEYRLINLPTTLLLPTHRASFELTHRFGANLARGSFSEHAKALFGLDNGALIGFEFRYAIARRLQAAAFRTNINRTIQLHGKYDAIRQFDGSPVSVSGLLSVEGVDNFTEDYSPALGAAVSRTLGDVAALYATPIWVHNVAPGLGVTRDTFFVGVGGRFRISSTVYLVAEVSPRLSGYQPGPPEFGFAIEKRAGGHMFQLNFVNTHSTTYGQVARGGATDTLYLGFNLARKFF